MERAADLVEVATGQSAKSGEALKEIVNMVDASADQVRAIAAASEEQSATSEEINKSVMHVNEIAAQTALHMREASTAVAELATQAQALSALIEEMKKE